MSFFKKLVFFFSFCLLAFIAASFVFIADPPASEPARADSNDNVSGWAWSENIGWVSFNCLNRHNRCDGDPDVSCTVDSNCVDAGAGTTCLAECTKSNYGVNIDSVTGNLSGYAYSPNVGWVSFQESSTPPDNYDFNKNGQCPGTCDSSNSCTACYKSSSKKIYGWAKVLSLGEKGWIHLQKTSSAGGFTYGVSLNTTTNKLEGWAWNGDSSDGSGIGWLSFNCADAGAGGCAVSNYAVTRDTPPSAQNLTVAYPRGATPAESYCVNPTLSPTHYDIGQMILRWTFSDGEDTTQSAYALEIDDSANFNSPVISTGKRTSAALQYFIGASGDCDPAYVAGTCNTLLSANTRYYWRVQVWDSGDNASEPTSGTSFVTEPHAYPLITNMTADPVQPAALENTYFTQTTAPATGESIDIWDWLFTDAQPTASTTPNPGPVQFQSGGAKTVTLSVTDSDNLTCARDLSVNVSLSLPIWREIKPR